MFYFFSFFYPKALYCTVVLNSSGPEHVPVHPADTLNSCSTSWSSDCHILRERAKTQTELLLGWDICEVHVIYREIVFSLRLLLSYITPPPPVSKLTLLFAWKTGAMDTEKTFLFEWGFITPAITAGNKMQSSYRDTFIFRDTNNMTITAQQQQV